MPLQPAGMPPVSSRLHQVLATGCGAWDEKTKTAVETPCGVALTFAEGGGAQPVLVLATHKSIDAFANGISIKWTPKPNGWKNSWNVLPPYPVSYSRFYAVSGVDINGDAEMIQSLGMYAFPAGESVKYKAWQTEVCKQCGCTSVVLFQSHP